MLGAVADRVDVGCGGGQPVVDQHTRTNLQAGRVRQCRPGAYPAGEHDQVAVEDVAARQLDALDLVRAAQRPRTVAEVDLGAQPAQGVPQCRRGAPVELTFYQEGSLMDDLRPHTERGQRAGDTDAEHPAADHHGAAGLGGVLGEPGAVGQRAQGVHTVFQARPVGPPQAPDRRQHRVGAGGEHQLVPALLGAVREPQAPGG